MPKKVTELRTLRIDTLIHEIRGHKVMLDADLATLYDVSTGNLNKAVKRNLDRFPDDFAFQLSNQEFTDLKFQSGTSSWGGRRKPPWAFTEQGIAMLSSVLKSERAIKVNIQIMRAFVHMRQLIAFDAELRRRLEKVEAKLGDHDDQLAVVIQEIRFLIASPKGKPPHPLGFRPKKTTNT